MNMRSYPINGFLEPRIRVCDSQGHHACSSCCQRVFLRPVDTAAPVGNVDNPAGTAVPHAAAAAGGVAHVDHRRLENSLREFPTVTTGDDGDEFL